MFNKILNMFSSIFNEIFSGINSENFKKGFDEVLFKIDKTFFSMLPALIVIFGALLVGAIFYCIFYDPESIEIRNNVKNLYANNDKRNLYHNLINSRKNQKKSQKEYFKVSDKFVTELLAADITMEPSEFLLMWAIIATVPAFMIYLLTSKTIMAVAIMLVGILGPFIYIKKKIADRASKFAIQFGDALKVICNGVQAGLSFQIAMRSVTKNMEDPIASEFERALLEMDYGVTQKDALMHMYERIKNPDLKILINTLSINQKTGGSLSAILSTISDTVKKRIKMKAEVAQMCAQGKTTSYVIGALPIIMFIFISIANPEYIEPLMTEEAGHIIIIVSIIMETLGMLIISKITDIKL